MIATILKTADGDFDYGAVIGALIFTGLICLHVWMFRGAIKTGHLPYGAGYRGSRIYWADRTKTPAGFWSLVVIYFLASVFYLYAVMAFCFGWFH